MSVPIRKQVRGSYVLGAMLLIAVVVGFPMYFEGAPLLLAAFSGACCGVVGVWAFAFIVNSFISEKLRVGDLVVVTTGMHTGVVGEVMELGKHGDPNSIVVLPEASPSFVVDLRQIKKL